MEVPIRCICPPTADGERRHEQDTVTLPDVLDFRRTVTVRQSIRLSTTAGEGLSLPELTAIMAEAYLLHCLDAWSLVGLDDKPLPLTKANIRERLLSNPDEAETVGDAADEMYSEKVVFPLLERASISSLPTPTPGPSSTSAPTNSSPTPKRRKPSKPSSISTSQMAVTGPMAASPAGASNSLQS